MNLAKMEMPKKDTKTPMKDAKVMNGSRPSSPEREVLVKQISYFDRLPHSQDPPTCMNSIVIHTENCCYDT